MKAIEEKERKARKAEIESLEEELNKHWGLGEVGDGKAREEGGIEDDGGKTGPRCYVEQTEWMGIRMSGKGPGFW